jgi:AraC-like DNA-binding protein
MTPCMTLEQINRLPSGIELPPSLIKQFMLTLEFARDLKYEKMLKYNAKYNGWIISHVAEGKTELITGGHNYEVLAGEVMIHPPNIAFSEINPNPGIHQYLILEAKLSINIDLLNVFPVYPVIRLENPELFRTTMSELCEWFNQPPNEWRDFYVYSLTTSILMMLIKSWHAMGKPKRPDSLMVPQERLIQIIDYMNTNYNKKISRTDFAEIMHVHPSHLDKKFRNAFKQTPMEMLREIRVKKAADLLQTSDYSLEVIATMCGLVDAAYLSRNFKHTFSVSPGEYRKQRAKIKEDWL